MIWCWNQGLALLGQGWANLIPVELLQLIKAGSAGRIHFSLGHLHPVKHNLSFWKSYSAASTWYNLLLPHQALLLVQGQEGCTVSTNRSHHNIHGSMEVAGCLCGWCPVAFYQLELLPTKLRVSSSINLVSSVFIFWILSLQLSAFITCLCRVHYYSFQLPWSPPSYPVFSLSLSLISLLQVRNPQLRQLVGSLTLSSTKFMIEDHTTLPLTKFLLENRTM